MKDIRRMRDAVLFEGPETRRRLSRFWILIVLASIIAAVIALMVIPASVPLTATSVTLARDTSRETKTLAVARSFGHSVGWNTGNATTRSGMVLVHMEGPPPLPNTDPLRNELKKRGVDPSDVRVELVPTRVATFD